MMPTILRVRNVDCSIDGARILNGVSFDVAAGESVAVLGPNGAGKTTLLRVLAGLVPYSGEAKLPAGEIRDLSRAKLRVEVSLVPQRLEYVPAFPIHAFLRLCGSVTPEVTSFAGVGSLLHRTISSLSGGELQRVLLAGAVAQNASLMLLDEPTASLDPKGRQVVRDALQELAGAASTTRVMVTHDVQLALGSVDTALVMKGGSIVWRGRVDDDAIGDVLSDVYECRFARFERPDGRGAILVPT